MKDGFLDKHVPKIRALYRDQCAAMLEALEHHMPAGVEWNRPEGGMFVWVTLPKHINTMKLLEAAIAENVAFVPGGPFFANEAEHNTLRLSFVTVPPAKIDEGVAKLGALIRARLFERRALNVQRIHQFPVPRSQPMANRMSTTN